MTTRTYTCNCDSKQRDFAEMKVHLRDVHKIDTTKTPFNRKALVFMDGAGWATQEYELAFGDLIIHESVLIEGKKK